MDFRTKRDNSSRPLVTIGVSSFNYSIYIEASLNSLLKQTYDNIELIIIDDCSIDDCPQKIENWIAKNNVHCTYIHHTKNAGITKTSNEIVRLSKGKYISLFATDDIMMSEKIERQVKLLEKAGEEYGMCYANVETINENDEPKGVFIKEGKVKFEGSVLESFVFGELKFATPSALIRKSVYETTGLYDERILIEDYNFWLRVFACFKVVFCEYPCIYYRTKERSDIFEKWNANSKERYYHDRIISNFQALSFIGNKKVKHYLRKKNTQYLKSLFSSGSVHFKKLFFYLFFRGYFTLPYYLLLKKSANFPPNRQIKI